MEALTQYGPAGLFIASFLAATVLPLSSEIVLGLLIANGHDPALLMGVATTGNVLGSVVNYQLGFWGGKFSMGKMIPISEQAFNRAAVRFRRYGTASLLFAWVPLIGDPLTVAAGVLRINFLLFLVLVTLGKGLRYLAIALAVA